MKKLVISVFATILVSAGVTHADSDRWYAGALLGTAAGLIVAHNVHGMNPWIAAPAGALIGGQIASRNVHGSRWDHGYRGYPSHYGYYDGRHGYYDDWRGYPYGYDYSYPVRQERVIQVREIERVQPVNLQPPVAPPAGADLIKLSILNSNGTRTDVPLLRYKEKFVGPQGEEYDTLPSTEILTRRYGK